MWNAEGSDEEREFILDSPASCNMANALAFNCRQTPLLMRLQAASPFVGILLGGDTWSAVMGGLRENGDIKRGGNGAEN